MGSKFFTINKKLTTAFEFPCSIKFETFTIARTRLPIVKNTCDLDNKKTRTFTSWMVLQSLFPIRSFTSIYALKFSPSTSQLAEQVVYFVCSDQPHQSIRPFSQGFFIQTFTTLGAQKLQLEEAFRFTKLHYYDIYILINR